MNLQDGAPVRWREKTVAEEKWLKIIGRYHELEFLGVISWFINQQTYVWGGGPSCSGFHDFPVRYAMSSLSSPCRLGVPAQAANCKIKSSAARAGHGYRRQKTSLTWENTGGRKGAMPDTLVTLTVRYGKLPWKMLMFCGYVSLPKGISWGVKQGGFA